MGTVRFRGFGMQFHVEATKNNTRRFRACLRHLPDYCSRSQGIWSQASRVFVPFRLLPVSVGCTGGHYRSKPRAASSRLLAASQFGTVPAARLRVYCSRSQVRGAALGRVVLPSALFLCLTSTL